MFLALRDLAHAKGRFALIVALVALMTLLVGFLTGLTGGLAMQNISSLVRLGPDRVVFSMADEDAPSFSTSAIGRDQFDAWRDAADAEAGASATPLGISSALVERDGESTAVALLAAPGGSPTDAPASGITVGESTADELGVSEGDTVNVAGTRLTVVRVIADQQYSHQDVAWISLEDWHAYLANTHQEDAFATVILVNGLADHSEPGTQVKGFYSSLLALDALKAEIGSLGMMIGMLVLIATLVIGVFFLVWSMQRQRDIAVLKAMGATTGWLAKDAIGQALLVLVIGAGAGVLATLGLGELVKSFLPFEITTLSILGPAVAMIVAGTLGSLVSLKQITRVDPTTALQASAA